MDSSKFSIENTFSTDTTVLTCPLCTRSITSCSRFTILASPFRKQAYYDKTHKIEENPVFRSDLVKMITCFPHQTIGCTHVQVYPCRCVPESIVRNCRWMPNSCC